MKKKSKTKSFLQNERAVSTVIGFVLIMGILISASTIYFSSQVPEWTKDFESLHTDDVADDFAELKSRIDSIVLKGEEGALAAGSTPIKMAPNKVPILGMSPPGSSLNFLPDDGKFEIIADVGGGGGEGNSSWVQNSFTDPNATYYRVDNSSNELKLAKITYDYPDLILDSPTEAERLGDVQYFDQVVITNGGTLYVAGAGFLKLCANNITVGPSGKITADYKGYWGGTTEKDGSGVGGGEAGVEVGNSGGGGGGAGYGDDGGDGGEAGGGAGRGAYGDATSNSSIQQGSGGGGGATGGHWVGGSGGNGGGAIWLDAEEINIAGGNISADGDYGLPGTQNPAGGGGGGSGGGILIKGRSVTISGNLSAKGGDGGDGGGSNGGGGGGGAGGRIKIFYESDSISLTPEFPISGSDADGDVGGAGGNASIYTHEDDYTSAIPCVEDGYYISEVYDTGNDSTCYGNMTWNADLNGQRIVMRVRTSMVEEMEGNATLWENCPAVSSGEDISDLTSASDGHRYIQYRVELYTEDTYMTPVLHSVHINYSYSAPGGGSPILAISSGIIKFNSNYLYYPNQQIVYEHGAVIKWQHEGGFMLHPPHINFTNKSGIPAIEISMVDLTGSNRSYSGATSTSLKNTYQSYNLLADSLKYPNLTINLTTEYSSVWGKWFNKTLEETTLTTPYHYNVRVDDTAKTVSVEFYGHGGGVGLYLEKTAVVVEI